MAVTLIIGAQWGDEGKGKIIDYIAKNSKFVVRFHGGNNAGHTVINKYGKFSMHLVPSGIFNPKVKSVIANGVVVDLEVLLEEIALLEKSGIKTKGRLIISPRCHLIMPYHKLLDSLYENAKGKEKTGTTGRGIGPVHADKVSYNGIRIFDLLDKKVFSKKLELQLLIKNKILQAFGEKPLDQEKIEKKFFELAIKIKPYISETYNLLDNALDKKEEIILEGAQGMFLDNDWGTYPFVTASTVLSSGATPGTGIPAKKIDDVIGVVKAYTTRVGEGPFPTELKNKTGEDLRRIGGEFGATTGRPRRCGWFDAELIKFAVRINGINKIAITKLDVLDSFSEIKICTHYVLNNKKVSYTDGDTNFISKVKPVYKTFKGWKSPTKGLTRYEDLPAKAKIYLARIEQLIGIKITYISTGPKTNETIKV